MKRFNETYGKRQFLSRNEWADTYKAIHSESEEKVIVKVLVNKSTDEITVGEEKYQVVGLIAYVNYSTLHEKSTDLMFDALKFNVAMVTDEGFA